MPILEKNTVGTPPSAFFRTDGLDSPYWRKLQAWDPLEHVVINTLAELPLLEQFLHKHEKQLCAGYLSYDLGMQLQGINHRHPTATPLAVFSAYGNWQEWRRGEWQFGPGQRDAEPHPESDQFEESPSPQFRFELELDREYYARSIGKIHDYIRQGDMYQVNFTQRLNGTPLEAPHAVYPTLLRNNPAEYACFYEVGDLAIISLSPELFLNFQQGVLTTEPIKGTRPRDPELKQDQINLNTLLDSAKEQAELFMITDLLRNDLGKVARIGSVHLEEVRGVKKLPKVWHTYSRIQAQLSNGRTPLDALLSMFPGGSITGCPKIRSMEIIDELEQSARGIYTGSIGYFHPDGDLSFNIAIRTLIQYKRHLSLGSGGGITIDSQWDQEWNELLVKATTFNPVLGDHEERLR